MAHRAPNGGLATDVGVPSSALVVIHEIAFVTRKGGNGLPEAYAHVPLFLATRGDLAIARITGMRADLRQVVLDKTLSEPSRTCLAGLAAHMRSRTD